MPTYEYRCPSGHEFEQFYRKISDAVAELPCPECGAPAQRQLSGGAGLLFKGSGFYLTDYGKNAHRKPAPASDNKTAGGKDETKPEVKPGATPEAKAAEAKPAEGKAGEGKPATGTSAKKEK